MNARKHWSVAKLRECKVEGAGGALDWMNKRDEDFNFED
jgi:hypothetical protein